MKFAKVVFIAGGVWGIAALAPFYWLVDISGRRYAAPVDYPQFFWGFFSVALAWQLAFLLIGSNPLRFRPLMVPAIVEKFGFIVTLAVLLSHGRITSADALAAIPDAVVGLSFIAAFAATSSEARLARASWQHGTPRDPSVSASEERFQSHHP
jgi:hypothetical protein